MMSKEFLAPPKAHSAYNPDRSALGKKLMKEGKVGSLIIAGGQGTRLGYEGPKGTFPLTSIHNKTLLQLAAERTLAASKQAGVPLQLAVMTSPQNDKETKEHFKDLAYKDLNVSFFTQEELPFLTDEGAPLYDSEGNIIKGPSGNGKCLHSFVKSGLFEMWSALGIEYINIIPVDNALALPFDPELLGWHAHLKGDVVAKCIARNDPSELVGVFIKEGTHLEVVEYSELPKTSLDLPYANIGLFSITMDFAKRVSTKELPLHKAFKEVKPLNVMAWKSEYFIFDILKFASTSLLLYPRDEVFAPLKNKTGKDSPESVRKLLSDFERALYKKITGKEIQEKTIEIDPQYYYWYTSG